MSLIVYNQSGVAVSFTADGSGSTRAIIAEVSSIRADGYELKCIKEKFNNSPIGTPDHAKNYSIPMVWDNQYMTWWGDIAKTILSNL